MQPVIIDAVVVCILVGFALYGAHRGLFRALAGLLSVVVALVGAGLLAKALAQPAADLLAPAIEKRIEQKVDQALSVQSDRQEMPESEAESELSQRVENLLELMGMDPETVETLSGRAMEKLQQTGVSLATAVVESLMYSVLYGILFILSFFALLLALRLLARAFDLVLKLPVLHGLNSIGGAAVGLLEAGVLLFLAVWVARRLGVSFETELVDATHILRFFTANTPLGVLSFLL